MSSFDREIILASAGSGKTYRLASRMIGLLAAGVSSQEILASTFTRKAAGEILDRVLERLALGAVDESEAEKLRASVPKWARASPLTSERCRELLLDLARELHRLHVHTLDAFFQTVIRSFATELGLPEGWTIADDADADRLRSRAVEEALDALDPGVSIELIRMLSARGEAGREVHALLLREVMGLHEVFREIDPEVTDPWGDPGWDREAGGDPTPLQVERWIAAFQNLDLPRTQKGTVNKTWEGAVRRAVERLRAREWEEMLESGLAKALLDGGDTFGNHPIPAEARSVIHEIFRAALRRKGKEERQRMLALGRFLPAFDDALSRLVHGEALFGFADLTHLLTARRGNDAFMERREELFYRLDGRIRHVLLDEFQDTSNSQWRALSPIADEIFASEESDRSIFIVADTKQSIYGWRGGEPRIFDGIRAEQARIAGMHKEGTSPLVVVETLEKSWRSSQVVLDAVNRMFNRLDLNPALAEMVGFVAPWQEAFRPHDAAKDLPGHVRLEVGPNDALRGKSTFAPRLLEYAAKRAGELHLAVPGATIGILTQTNKNTEYLIAHLRRMGVEASGEGGVPIVDSAPVIGVLALLRMADHPGDRISRYLVARTPLGALVGLGPEEWRDDARVEEVAERIRRRLVEEGYGRVLREWAGALEPGLDARDAGRVRQLVELAFRWDPRATLRPSDFVHMVEKVRREDPAAARVRVMTIHRAKGLEFDIVLLPDLDGLSLSGEGGERFFPLRRDDGAVERIFPAPPASRRLLLLGRIPEVAEAFPEIDFAGIQEATSQAIERDLRDALSVLYVGVTRPRHALHIFVAAESEKRREEKAKGNGKVVRRGGEFLRCALAGSHGARAAGDGPQAGDAKGDVQGSGANELAEEVGDILFESGDPEWWRDGRVASAMLRTPRAPTSKARPAPPSGKLPVAPRRRLLPVRTPSELEGGETVSLAHLLRSAGGPGGESLEGAFQRGSLVHGWLAGVEWVETTGLPDREALLAYAAANFPAFPDPGEPATAFAGWMEHPEVVQLLRRENFPAGTTVARELPFLARDGERILRGIADRVVRIPDPEGDRLLVIDWKTDRITGTGAWNIEERVAFYTPQVQAYMRGLSASEGVPIERVEGALVFLDGGVVRKVAPTALPPSDAPQPTPRGARQEPPPGSRSP